MKFLKYKLFWFSVKWNIFKLFDNWDEVKDYVIRLYDATKGSTMDELKKDFIHELASIVHDSAEKEREENGEDV